MVLADLCNKLRQRFFCNVLGITYAIQELNWVIIQIWTNHELTLIQHGIPRKSTPASIFKAQSKNMNERFLNRNLLRLLPLCINMRSLNMIVLLVRLLSFYKCKTRSNDFFISNPIQGDSALCIKRITIQFSSSDRVIFIAPTRGYLTFFRLIISICGVW